MTDSTKDVCILSSEEEELYFCKELLVEHSDFFKALFDSGMKECQENRITLPTLSTQSIQLAIDFMRDTKPDITLENLTLAFEVGTYLQMSQFMEFCTQSLRKILSCDNCFEIREMAEEFMIHSLQDNVIEFMCSRFYLVSRKKEFLLLPLEAILKVIQSNDIASNERDIFDVSCQWIKRYKKRNVSEVLNQVFDCIRFPTMSVYDLEQCKRSLESIAIDTRCTAFASISVASECLRDPRLLLHKDLGEKALPRRMAPCVVAMGGFTKSNATTNRLMLVGLDQLCASDNNRLTWRCPSQSKNCPRLRSPLCEHSVAKVGVFIYVVGGQTQYCQDGRHTSKDAYCLDTRTFQWVKVRNLLFYSTVY